MECSSIYNRRSIRKFLNKAVSKDIIDEIIDAGRMAPSAKNAQPWRYIVYGNKNKQELLDCMEAGIAREEKSISYMPKVKCGILFAKNTLKIMREAPIVILVLNPKAKSPFSPISTGDRVFELMDTLSIGVSIENILLRAEEIGLGTLWIANTMYAYNELIEYLSVEEQLVGAIAVGYTDEKPPQPSRKKLEEIVEYRL